VLVCFALFCFVPNCLVVPLLLMLSRQQGPEAPKSEQLLYKAMCHNSKYVVLFRAMQKRADLFGAVSVKWLLFLFSIFYVVFL
jgi:hypothetical protein